MPDGGGTHGNSYQARAALERELADRSSDPRLKRIHENMARIYAALSESDPGLSPPVSKARPEPDDGNNGTASNP